MSDAPDSPSRGGWIAVIRRNRLLWIIAAVATVSLIAGLLVGRFVVSPADAASRSGPPEAGLITVPVQFGELSNDVVLRGEVAYADPVEVRVDISAIAGPAVVTGQVPEAGAELGALSVAIEIVGRPVIVLPGELPAYRTLGYGVSGPDVVQFKTAMRAVGIDAGDPANNVFDAMAANAVTALYAQAGYPVSNVVGGAADEVRAAQDAVRSAEDALAQAQTALDLIRGGPSAVDVRQADNAVAGARRALEAADPADAAGIAALRDELALEELRRTAVSAPRDSSIERSAVDSAREQLADAHSALARAREAVLPTLPAGEVLYLTELPRRVDAVTVVRGSVLEGVAMTVSGATLGLSGSAAEADARLLESGDEAVFDLPDGTEHRAVISAITPGTDAEPRWTIDLTPDPLTPEQVTELQGSNVRVSVAVGATEGEVLSVPLAALSAGTGGESRVEVVDGDPREGQDAETRLVVVETGLAADGAVEVRPVDGELAQGDLVVVGE